MNQAEPQNGTTYKAAPKAWVSMKVLYYEKGHEASDPKVGWITAHDPMQVTVNYIVPRAGAMGFATGVLHMSDPRYKLKMRKGAWDYTPDSLAQAKLEIDSTEYEKIETVRRVEEVKRNVPVEPTKPKAREIVDFLVECREQDMKPGEIRDALKASHGIHMHHLKIMQELKREGLRCKSLETVSTDGS